MIFLSVLRDVVLPVFIVVAFGYTADRLLHIDPKPISRISLYVLSPCLIFTSLFQSSIGSRDFALLVGFMLLQTFSLAALGLVLARLLSFGQQLKNVFLLSTLFVNAGNLGLPLNLFAFGEEGFNLAIVCFVTQAVLTNTMAVYFASRSDSNALSAIANVLRMPLLYAALLAIAVNLSGAAVPTYLLKPVKLAGDAAVPLMLLLLGLQLSRTSLAGQLGYVGLATAVRLLLAPALAYGLSGTLVLAGLTRKVAILQASMPTGVMTGLLAVEFDARPDLVTGVIFTSTLLSLGTLTVLIGLLR